MPRTGARRWTPAALALLVTGGCAGLGGGAAPIDVPSLEDIAGQARVELTNVPFHPQEQAYCGPAALATVLGDSGVAASVPGLVDEVYLPGRRGTLQVELLGATRRHGRMPYELNGALPALVAELDAGRPVLVLQNLGWREPRWHYAVVIGYDAGAGELILRSGRDRRKTVGVRRFLWTWQRDGGWAMVVLRPGEIPAQPDYPRFRDAAAALEAAGRHDEALAAWRSAVERWPDEPVAWLGLGNMLHVQADAEAAATSYRRSLALDPDSPAARNNLARILVERGCRRPALALVEPALTALPDDSVLRDALLQTRDTARALQADPVPQTCADLAPRSIPPVAQARTRSGAALSLAGGTRNDRRWPARRHQVSRMEATR